MSEQEMKVFNRHANPRLAGSFEHYANPARDILLAMRRAAILHKTGPEEAMEYWMTGQPAPGMSRLPVPFLDKAERRVFLRLKTERDAIQIASGTVEQERWTRNSLWSAMHVMAVQAVDPWWNGQMLKDVQLPNLLDWGYVSHPDGQFYKISWDARSNMSFLVATSDEARIPDFSRPSYTLPNFLRSPLTREVLDRLYSSGMRLRRALDEVLGEEPSEGSRDSVLADLTEMGLHSPDCLPSDMHSCLLGVSIP